MTTDIDNKKTALDFSAVDEMRREAIIQALGQHAYEFSQDIEDIENAPQDGNSDIEVIWLHPAFRKVYFDLWTLTTSLPERDELRGAFLHGALMILPPSNVEALIIDDDGCLDEDEFKEYAAKYDKYWHLTQADIDHIGRDFFISQLDPIHYGFNTEDMSLTERFRCAIAQHGLKEMSDLAHRMKWPFAPISVKSAEVLSKSTRWQIERVVLHNSKDEVFAEWKNSDGKAKLIERMSFELPDDSIADATSMRQSFSAWDCPSIFEIPLVFPEDVEVFAHAEKAIETSQQDPNVCFAQ